MLNVDPAILGPAIVAAGVTVSTLSLLALLKRWFRPKPWESDAPAKKGAVDRLREELYTHEKRDEEYRRLRDQVYEARRRLHCSTCGRSSDAGTKFCAQCGTILDRHAALVERVKLTEAAVDRLRALASAQREATFRVGDMEIARAARPRLEVSGCAFDGHPVCSCPWCVERREVKGYGWVSSRDWTPRPHADEVAKVAKWYTAADFGKEPATVWWLLTFYDADGKICAEHVEPGDGSGKPVIVFNAVRVVRDRIYPIDETPVSVQGAYFAQSFDGRRFWVPPPHLRGATAPEPTPGKPAPTKLCRGCGRATEGERDRCTECLIYGRPASLYTTGV